MTSLEETLARVRGERQALTVACPACSAQPGEPCDLTEPATLEAAEHRPRVHSARLEAARNRAE